ncbi:MAG TPA: arylesterase [Polyangiales bacterium]|nr:arylesterase [Polyangiales bacterium]
MKLALAFAIALLVACSREEPALPSLPPEPVAAASGPSVAFLGDSITAGFELRAEEAYPALVRAQLAQSGKDFRLINAGVSGDTTSGGLRRVDWLLTQKPKLVVIELGANDGMRGAPLPEIEKNLRAIVDKVRAAGAGVLLLGMRLPPSYGEPYATDFAALYDRVAQELTLPYVPFFMQGVAGIAALTQADGLHPTAEGHAKLAANVAPALARLL